MQTVLKGVRQDAVISPESPTVLIGERINPTGRKAFSAELQAGDLSRVARDAEAQVAAGADVLDVNVGAVGVDEVDLLPQAVRIVQDTVGVPVSIDSANPDAIAAALKVVQGRALINSVNGEEERLKAILPIAAEYGACVIGLCMDDNGIPTTPEARLAVAAKILERAAQVGLGPESILIDPLVLTVGADYQAVITTITTARLVREKFGCNMTAGVSNASHGMPDRELLNTVFLAGYMSAGVNAPIINPLKNGLAVRAADLMLGRDEMGMRYITMYRAVQAAQQQG
jgi:5-methyltetrahydrofolate--homocysteine methyltransferase